MKLGFVKLKSEERRLYFEQAAARRNVSAVILEKDFWVCWLLGILFESPFAGSLVFKGGTSLSKVFGVIERFSEDIDLSLAPEFLQLPEAGTSRNQANKWMERAKAACSVAVQTQIAPVLDAAVTEAVLLQPVINSLLSDVAVWPYCFYEGIVIRLAGNRINFDS